VRTTSHTRVGGRAEVSVGGRVEVRRALGRARMNGGATNGVVRSIEQQRLQGMGRGVLCAESLIYEVNHIITPPRYI